MNSDDPHVYYSTSDGHSWTEVLPERVVRDLALCRAIDTLGLRLTAAQEVAMQATSSVHAISPETPAAELIAAWRQQTELLTTAIIDMSRDGNAVIDAAKRALGLT